MNQLFPSLPRKGREMSHNRQERYEPGTTGPTSAVLRVAAISCSSHDDAREALTQTRWNMLDAIEMLRTRADT